jgi:hypothetical protein
MTGGDTGGDVGRGDTGGWALGVARAAVRLYPAAWRERYGDEVLALVEEAGADLRTVGSLVWQAGPTWVWPARHLYDRGARMRASLATTGVAWAVLAGLAVVFAQLTQGQPSLQQDTVARHPVISWAYFVFDGFAGLSVLAVLAGGVPLWLAMMRRARGGDRLRLLAPVVVPVGYLAVTILVVRLVRQPDGAGGVTAPGRAISVVDVANGNTGPWWFLALVVLGFVAAVVSAAGPAAAVRRMLPGEAALGVAARAAGVAAGTMGLAVVASIVAAIGLYRWAPADAGYHQGWQLAVYLPAVVLAAAVALVSSERGIRAARSVAAG